MPGFPGVVTAGAGLARVSSVPVIPDEVQGPRDGLRRRPPRLGLTPDLRDRYALPRVVIDLSTTLTTADLDEAGTGRETAVVLVRRG
jgi:hypothetical protein